MSLKGTWINLFNFLLEADQCEFFESLTYFALPLEIFQRHFRPSEVEFKRNCFRKPFQRVARLSPHYVNYFYLSFSDIFPKRTTVFNTRQLFSLFEANVTSLMRRNFTMFWLPLQKSRH